MSTRPEQKKTAYHEAGHAVITWYYNRPIMGASVITDGDLKGEIKIILPYR
jgi:ATP-dependent Zn protease